MVYPQLYADVWVDKRGQSAYYSIVGLPSMVESYWTAQCTSHLEHHYYVIYGNTLGLL